jgi:hypothetical protein
MYERKKILVIFQKSFLQLNSQYNVKRAETSIILMVFDGVLSEVCAYTVTISYHGST